MTLISLNPAVYDTPHRTVVVMGVARSGTSMIAKVLETLGLFMGENQTKGSLEDKEISSLLEGFSTEQEFAKLIKERNNSHEVWGWKRPGAFKTLEKFEKHLRNPLYIFMIRDIAAISIRRSMAVNSDLKKNFFQAQKQYMMLVDFILNTSTPSLIVPNETANINKAYFIDSLINFLGIEVNKETRKLAIETIEPNDNNYLLSMKKNQEKKGLNSYEKSENTGISVLNPVNKISSNKSVVILGLAGSETYKIAGVAKELGIYVGVDSNKKKLEDKEYIRLVEKGNGDEDVNTYILNNNKNKLWAINRPKAINHITSYENIFPNIHYLILFKDSCSIAAARSTDVPKEFCHNFKLTTKQQKKLTSFVQETSKPCMLISHEKMRLNSNYFIDQLIYFLGISPSKEQKTNAKKWLTGSEKNGKMHEFDRQRYVGVLEPIKNNIVKGWAIDIGDNNSIKLDLFINGKLIDTILANQYRKKLAVNGIGKGHHAYIYDISSHIASGKEYKITVKPHKTDLLLNNCPKSFKP